MNSNLSLHYQFMGMITTKVKILFSSKE